MGKKTGNKKFFSKSKNELASLKNVRKNIRQILKARKIANIIARISIELVLFLFLLGMIESRTWKTYFRFLEHPFLMGFLKVYFSVLGVGLLLLLLWMVVVAVMPKKVALNKQEKQILKGWKMSFLHTLGVIVVLLFLGFLMMPRIAKPVIYLYPTEPMEVSVELDLKAKLTTTYPVSKNAEWQVMAYPGGKIINQADQREYSYLYWEGESYEKWNIQEGFVVRGEDTAEFLQETLAKMGLVPREYNEMIVYWLPLMERNPYNLIHFAGEEYEKLAPLKITPEPDSMLRVFMVYKPLKWAVKVPEQKIEPFARKGFTVVEWGGTEIR